MLHSHAVSHDGVGIPLSTSGGPAHYHAAIHPTLGEIRTDAMSDDLEHRHQYVGPDGTLYQTGAPIDADVGLVAEPLEAEPVETEKSIPEFPDVLTWDAVRSGRMPSTGSGLPESLEKGVPARFRYWKVTDPSDQLLVRRALVESETLTPETVRPVAVRNSTGIAAPSLMRVARTEAGTLHPVSEPDGPVEVPKSVTDISVAAALAGLDAGAKLYDTGTIEAVTSLAQTPFSTMLKRALDSGDEWIFEIPSGSSTEEAIQRRYDGCTVFKLNHTDAVSYIASGIPEEGTVRFVKEPNPGVRGGLEIGRNLSPDDIHKTASSGALTPYQRGVGATRAELARKDDWDINDLRSAHRIRVLLDSEMGREPDARRTDFLKVLGVDTEAAGQELLAKADTIRIVKFHDADPDSMERLVWGVVLEPDVGDLQGDVLTTETIRRAFYTYAEFHRQVGIQHDEIVEGKARITQIYLAPCDFVPEGCGEDEMVYRGSWVQEYRILCDDLWLAILCGDFTGFSIGGTGTRVPLDAA